MFEGSGRYLKNGAKVLIGWVLYPGFWCLGVKLLGVNAKSFGHLVLDTECFFRSDSKKFSSRWRFVLLVGSGELANKSVPDLWRDVFVWEIRSMWLARFLRTTPFIAFDLKYSNNPNRPNKASRILASTMPVANPAPMVGRFFDKFGRLVGDRKIVVIHCRQNVQKAVFESGVNTETYRDVDIASFIPAMRFLVESNYFVIKVGGLESCGFDDPLFFDAHRGRSDYDSWWDVAFAAAAYLFIGCGSGGYCLAAILGKQIISVSVLPLNYTLPHCISGIGIPKKIFSADGARISLHEGLSLGYGGFCSDAEYMSHKLSLEDNSPEAIIEAIKLCLIEDYVPELLQPLNDLVVKGCYCETSNARLFEEKY